MLRALSSSAFLGLISPPVLSSSPAVARTERGAAAALSRGQAGVGSGGGGAAGGVPGGGQGEGRGAPATPAHPSSQAAPCRVSACALSLARRRAAQDGRLPLQLALRNGDSIEVVAALLTAHPQAEDEVDNAMHRAVLERAKAQSSATAAAGSAAEAGGSSTASDPFAHTFASSAEAAAALVDALKAHAPDDKVLQLITKEVAATKDQVSLHS